MKTSQFTFIMTTPQNTICTLLLSKNLERLSKAQTLINSAHLALGFI